VDREVVGACVALALGGGAIVLTCALASRRGSRCGALPDERAAALRLVLPVFPAVLAWVFVLGWGLQEPNASDERIGLVWVVAALTFGAVLVRATLRAVRSAGLRRIGAAATVGLLRPRIVVSPALRARLDTDALAAAVAHEAAHARHRDPLRLLFAQFVADLQWPFAGARRRLAEWREALEYARDDEARRGGARGDDLAQAILAAASLQSRAEGAALTGDDEGARLRHRIERLLGPIPVVREEPRRWWALVTPLLFGIGAAGVVFGDDVLRLLPGVGW
jgi:hypothetical protein